jgi:hypothetical protein
LQIEIEDLVKADPQTVWDSWNNPEDIKRWNAASDDWHTTASTVDLRVGGRFLSRMEAKDGSAVPISQPHIQRSSNQGGSCSGWKMIVRLRSGSMRRQTASWSKRNLMQKQKWIRNFSENDHAPEKGLSNIPYIICPDVPDPTK